MLFYLKLIEHGKRCSFFLVAVALITLSTFNTAQATTAFSRQTGEPCTACHMQSYGPWLTPYGQKFKLDGYVAGHANKLPDIVNPFAVEFVGSVSNTQKDVPNGQYYDNTTGQSKGNNNVVNDWDALYYTGRVFDKVGAYLQLNFDPQIGRSVSLAMADIRFADHATLWGKDITYGVTVNNSPTMSDTWVTSYAWMYPYTTSSMAPAPVAQPFLATLMSGAYTAGSTAYAMIDNHLYLEAGGYTSQPRNMAKGLGVWKAAQGSELQNGLIDGGAPYWRAYFQHNTGKHWMMIGTYGFIADVFPFYEKSAGTDKYEEYNIDANYHYMMDDDNMLMGMFRYTHDKMNMKASQALGFSENSSNHLDSVMLMGMWTYKQTYNLAFGWNYMSGSSDFTLYGGADPDGNITPVSGSANGSPNTNSFLVELDYVPFGKGSFVTDPYVNLRLSLQYWAYTKFNGASSNYDGNGRNAEANNTLYFVGNLMF